MKVVEGKKRQKSECANLMKTIVPAWPLKLEVSRIVYTTANQHYAKPREGWPPLISSPSLRARLVFGRQVRLLLKLEA